MRWWHWALIAAAVLVAVWLVNRSALPVRPPTSGAGTGGGGSILDSANRGASGIKKLLVTIFGSTPTGDAP